MINLDDLNMLDSVEISSDGALPSFPIRPIGGREMAPSIQSRMRAPITDSDRALAEVVARSRPIPIRAFDQISMRTDDLARQARLIAPSLAHQRIVFVGDMDGTASLLGLLAVADGPVPTNMLLLDFDVRVLEAALGLAHRHGFAHLLSVRLYNCFDPVPPDLIGEADWFYINPPYGSRNDGASARLFLTRGCEIVRPNGGSGCLIVPDDRSRPWTRRAMGITQDFLSMHGWAIREQVHGLHRYYLDDDPSLTSSLVIVDRKGLGTGSSMPFAGRRVGTAEIPYFYGRNTLPPYPTAINREGVMIGNQRED